MSRDSSCRTGRGESRNFWNKCRSLSPLVLLLAAMLLCTLGASAQVYVGGVQSSITGPWNSSDTGPVGVASDSSGNIYIGEHKAQDIIKIDGQTHVASVFISSSTSVCGFNLGRIQFMAIDASNNLYITDPTNGEIFEYSIPGGSCTAYYSATSPFGIALDSSGNIYYTDNTPGTSGVYEILAGSANGTSGTQLFSGLASASGIAFDPTTSDMLVADQSSGTIWKYTAVSGYAAASQSSYLRGLNQPYGLSFDSSKNLLVANSGSGQFVKYLYPGYATSILLTPSIAGAEGISSDPSGNILTTAYSGDTVTEISPTSSFGSVPVGSVSSSIAMNFEVVAGTTIGSIQVLDQGTSGLEFNALSPDSNPNLCTAKAYTSTQVCTLDVTFTPKFAGTRYGAVELLDASGNVLATAYVYGTGSGPQVNFVPGTESVIAQAASLNPQGVAVDASGNVYFADFTNHMVYRETPAGVTIVVANAASGLDSPEGVAVDGAGNVYIADSGISQILKETPTASGYVQSVVANIGNNGLNNSCGVAVDVAGNVYIADSSNSRILKEALSGGSYTQSVIPTSAKIPMDVAVDIFGNLYIANFGDNNVLMETLSNGSYTESTIGSGLSNPTGVAVDGVGNVYIADYYNNRVLKETLSSGSYTQGWITTSSLIHPSGVAVDGSGNIYLSDVGNARVLKEDLADAPILSFATATPVGSWDTTDGAQILTLENIGNAALSFQVPATDWNPSLSNDFTSNSTGASACPEVIYTASAALTLPANTSCTFSLSFTPLNAGPRSGALVLTDNALNAAGSVQSVQLSGTATKGTPTITWTTPSAITYGTPLSATQLNATASIAGTSVLGTFTYTPAAGTVLSARTHTLSVTFTPNDTTDYTSATSTVQLTVNQAQLTVAIVGNPTKSYDGTKNIASLTSTNYQVTGLMGTESVTVSQPNATFNSMDVLSATTVTASLTAGNYTAGAGTNLANYVLPASVSGPATITAFTLTAKIVGNPTKSYDGTINITSLTSANYQTTGLVGSESITISQPNGTFNSKDVLSATTVTASLTSGNYTAGVGTNLANYVLPTSASGPATITAFTLTANIVGNPTKLYDGTKNIASLTSTNYQVTGLVGSESITVSQPNGTFNSKDVLSATTVTASLTPGNYTAGAGASLANYMLPTSASGSGTIMAATLAAKIIGDPTKLYDSTINIGTLAPANFSLSGLIGSESITVNQPNGIFNFKDVLTATTVTTSLANGNYTAGPGSLLSNYVLPNTASGAGQINPAPVTLTANNQSIFYGQKLLTLGALQTQPAFTPVGLQNGETVGSVTILTSAATNSAGTATLTTDPVLGSPYTLVPSLATGGTFTASNYTFSYVTGTLTIKPAPVTITAYSPTIFYGQQLPLGAGQTAATFTTNTTNPPTPGIGMQNGEIMGSVTITTSNSAMNAAGTATLTTDPVLGSPYTLVPSLATPGTFTPSNYTFNYVNGALTVKPTPLTITANPDSKIYGQTKTYGTGQTTFTHSGTTVTPWSGLQNGETVGAVTITASGGTVSGVSSACDPVTGSYALTPSNPLATSGGFLASNYNITYVSKPLTLAQAATNTIMTAVAAPTASGALYTYMATVTPQIPAGANCALPSETVTFAGLPPGITTTSVKLTSGTGSATVPEAATAASSSTYLITPTYGGNPNSYSVTAGDATTLTVAPSQAFFAGNSFSNSFTVPTMGWATTTGTPAVNPGVILDCTVLDVSDPTTATTTTNIPCTLSSSGQQTSSAKPTLTVSSGATVNVSVGISNGSSASASGLMLRPVFAIFGLPVFGLLVFGLPNASGRRRRNMLTWMVLMLVVIALLGLASCGGGFSNAVPLNTGSGAVPGSYVVVVNGTYTYTPNSITGTSAQMPTTVLAVPLTVK